MSIFLIPPQESQNQAPVDPAQAARTLLIIRVSLVFGVIMFLGIALVMVKGELQFEFDFLEIIASVFAASAIVVCVVIGRLFMNSQLPKNGESGTEEQTQSLIQNIVATEIIRGAILEGAAFFATTLIIIENSGIGMVIAILMVVMSVVTIPTTGRIQNKLENLRHQLRC